MVNFKDLKREGVEYQSVAGDETEVQHKPDIRQNGQSRHRRLLWIIGTAVLAVTTAFIGVAVGNMYPLKLHWPSQKVSSEVTFCGHTSAEAIAAGCVMEPLTYAWMSPECYYPEISELHNVFRDFAWFRDEELTIPVTEEQLMKGELLKIWTADARYHLWHCLFLMRKLYYAVDNQVEWIDSKTVNAHHAYHCVGQLEELAHGENGTTLTHVELGIYHCERPMWRK